MCSTFLLPYLFSFNTCIKCALFLASSKPEQSYYFSNNAVPLKKYLMCLNIAYKLYICCVEHSSQYLCKHSCFLFSFHLFFTFCFLTNSVILKGGEKTSIINYRKQTCLPLQLHDKSIFMLIFYLYLPSKGIIHHRQSWKVYFSFFFKLVCFSAFVLSILFLYPP